jgi:hypothetical protein
MQDKSLHHSRLLSLHALAAARHARGSICQFFSLQALKEVAYLPYIISYKHVAATSQVRASAMFLLLIVGNRKKYEVLVASKVDNNFREKSLNLLDFNMGKTRSVGRSHRPALSIKK